MNGRFVLYAEDDENDAFLLERAFQKAGIPDLRIVPDGQAVVDYLSGHAPYDDRAAYPLPFLVLLDINMPRLSGLEALAWIRRQSLFAALPVVMLTSSLHDKDLRHAYSRGATAFLVKSANAATLVEIAKSLRGILTADSVGEADFDRFPGYLKRPEAT